MQKSYKETSGIVTKSAIGTAGARVIVDEGGAAGAAMGISSTAGLEAITACCCWSIPTSKSSIRFTVLVAGAAAGATVAGGASRVRVGIASLAFLLFRAVIQADLSKCFESGGHFSVAVL